MEPVTLTTSRLTLRPLEPSDVDAVLAACQDPEIPRWTTVPSPYTHEHAVDFVERISPEGWRDDTLYNFGVFTRESGALVSSMGLVRLAQLPAPGRQAELGYWTVKEQRGQGYTAEAGRAVCDWAFSALGVERLEWFAEAGNVASRAVALRIGFVMEGTLRSKTVQRGTRRDTWSAALLPSDWGRDSATAYLPHDPGKPST
ncbi:GNAT family N-acetyltransferase [Streptomyces cocklensis]|jgi:RimJ/RimL family protein N-acetyltransferase|uniref:Protein N-acetyltransferase, RimJ/RimL family n=1 Tax=Actinacidiphila cocklensis TaxID=887465 RepID=A0A9W4DZM1_9ACTN|nr:GNAT family N-acetyltransferase [Actinacidiphila cocklensis]MDD1058384.1 GNAT family N-acetyltransferase [Actinacidiphila cocklensis]WSX79220.1 GNAT family N-acetyltransferase [Streptomyces sp. NBC_00899]CAG6396769.1 Protein N-acetyltransferase, RimJ/RimL family [Actinacidiphila cocklensis]